jgi:uncharacterized membrane protein
MPHQFLLDIDKDGSGDVSDCPTTDPCTSGLSTTGGTVTFTASTAGSFTYYCYVHPGSMVGVFVVQPPGFAMASNPSSLSIAQGSSSTSTITLSSERGFSGTINLIPTVPAGGPSVAVNPTSVTVSPGSSAMSTLTVSTSLSTGPGTYTVTVGGTSSSTTNTTTVVVAVIIPAFSISSSPGSISIISSSTSNTTSISVTSLNGFSGKINLTATTSQQGLIVSFNPISITISSGGSGTSTMTVSTSSAPPGFYTVTVHGTSSSAANTTTVAVSVTIPDFRVSPSPPVLSVVQGSTVTATITLTSLSGFKSSLTLTGTASPSGPSVSFSPASVTLSSGGSVTSTMTVSAPGGKYPVAAGSYAVTVTVTNGTLTHTTTIPVEVVTSPPSGIPLTVLIGVSAAIISAAGVAIYLLRKRLGGNKQPAVQGLKNP